MGNPHAVLFLEDIDAATAQAFAQDPQSFDLEGLGAGLESDIRLFPQKTNVEVAAVCGSACNESALSGTNRIRMRVYERGVGETLACGTGACAVAVAAIVLGKVDGAAPVDLELPGGTLTVAWLPDNQVLLTGPVASVFCGTLSLDSPDFSDSLESPDALESIDAQDSSASRKSLEPPDSTEHF
jgi:diaminopimelate epimerase